MTPQEYENLKVGDIIAIPIKGFRGKHNKFIYLILNNEDCTFPNFYALNLQNENMEYIFIQEDDELIKNEN